MIHHGEMYVGYGKHSLWINTPGRPQGLDVWIEYVQEYHCGGVQKPTLSPVHCEGHGFGFDVTGAEGSTTVKWKYES